AYIHLHYCLFYLQFYNKNFNCVCIVILYFRNNDCFICTVIFYITYRTYCSRGRFRDYDSIDANYPFPCLSKGPTWLCDGTCRDGDKRCSSCRADRKSTRLNSSHVSISYAVFCLKKKKKRKVSNETSLRV